METCLVLARDVCLPSEKVGCVCVNVYTELKICNRQTDQNFPTAAAVVYLVQSILEYSWGPCLFVQNMKKNYLRAAAWLFFFITAWRLTGISSLVVGDGNGSQAKQNSARQAESATGRQIEEFVVEDTKQADIPENQASKAGWRGAGRQLVLGGLTHHIEHWPRINPRLQLKCCTDWWTSCRCAWFEGAVQILTERALCNSCFKYDTFNF